MGVSFALPLKTALLLCVASIRSNPAAKGRMLVARRLRCLKEYSFMSTLKLTREEFKAEMLVFGSTMKKQWDLATKLAVTAVLHYREDGESLLVAELHELFTNSQSGEFTTAFEKMVWAMTNLKFKQDEDDLNKAVTVVASGDNPSTYVDAITNTESHGLQVWGGKIKSASKAKRLNQNGAKPVTAIKGVDDPTKGKKLSAEQQAQAETIQAETKAKLEAVLNGSYKPGDNAGAATDFGIHFKDEEQAAAFDSMVKAMAEVSIMDPDKLSGAIKHCTNQMSQVKASLVKLANVA